MYAQLLSRHNAYIKFKEHTMPNYQWRFNIEISAKNETEAEELIAQKMREIFVGEDYRLNEKMNMFNNLRRVSVEMEGT
jgi:hypothetical protein